MGLELRDMGMGNVMHCHLDGSSLEKVANGFWNPFDIKFISSGKLLLTDNDPYEACKRFVDGIKSLRNRFIEQPELNPLD